jgi:hypothetical protein
VKYYRLVDDVSLKGRWHLGELVGQLGVPIELDEGKPVDLGPLRSQVVHTGFAPDFCLTSFNAPVASSRLALAMASVAGNDLQLLPLHVDNAPSLWALNSSRTIDCLDENRSTFQKWNVEDQRADLLGQYRSVSKPRLDGQRIPVDSDIFRIARWTTGLVVSSRMRGEMERCGCTGAEFIGL